MEHPEVSGTGSLAFHVHSYLEGSDQFSEPPGRAEVAAFYEVFEEQEPYSEDTDFSDYSREFQRYLEVAFSCFRSSDNGSYERQETVDEFLPDPVTVKSFLQNTNGTMAVTVPKPVRAVTALSPGDHLKIYRGGGKGNIILEPLDI